MNQHTANAAETITGFAKENEMATIVGTKTLGQVLRGAGFKIGHGFVFRIPVVTFHTWSGNTLEGIGVEPDDVVGFSRDPLKESLDAQIEPALHAAHDL